MASFVLLRIHGSNSQLYIGVVGEIGVVCECVQPGACFEPCGETRVISNHEFTSTTSDVLFTDSVVEARPLVGRFGRVHNLIVVLAVSREVSVHGVRDERDCGVSE